MAGQRGHADGLRMIAGRLDLPALSAVARRPGINAAYRLSIQYHDGRYADQVATLTHSQNSESELAVVYRRFTLHPVLEYMLDEDRFHAFNLALRRLRFDQLDDQPGIPLYGVDFWLIERASGSYFHDVVLAPEHASGAHAWLVDVFRTHLPEAVRPIPAD
ncbi:MAG: hypothetical protein JXN59_07040 [Anaerolineae bacterium]|nr:hypothetical protein [Anaerolineae bacterium]